MIFNVQYKDQVSGFALSLIHSLVAISPDDPAARFFRLTLNRFIVIGFNPSDDCMIAPMVKPVNRFCESFSCLYDCTMVKPATCLICTMGRYPGRNDTKTSRNSARRATMAYNRFLCGECIDTSFHGKCNTSDSMTCYSVLSASAGNSFAGIVLVSAYNRRCCIL